MNPRVIWHYSPEFEAQRLIHTAKNIGNRFYQINGFSVLPAYTKNNLGNQIVIMPDLNFHAIARFWDKVSQVNIAHLPIIAPKELEKAILAQLSLTKPDFSVLKASWEQAETDLFSALSNILSKRIKITAINLIPTNIGTSCSFNALKGKETEVWAYIRVQDGSVGKIVEAILSSFIYDQVKHDLAGTWSESEMVTDWLLTHSSLSEVIAKYDPEYQPTIKTTRQKQSTGLIKDSEKYLAKLGFGSPHMPFSYDQNNYSYNNKKLLKLSPLQKDMLTLFISESIVKTEQLAELLFDSEDDFSLYAISKQIERLRNKLEFNGISGSVIQTVRGQGYRLRK